MTGIEIFSLSGKCAVITGAGGAIGSTIAQALSAAGAKVFLQDFNQVGLTAISNVISTSGGQSWEYICDLSDISSIEPFIATAAEKMGGIDILINCAGINRRNPID